MDFETTLERLKLVTNNWIAIECFEFMTDGIVLFHEGFVQEKEKLALTYSRRLHSTLKFKANSFREDVIENWTIAVDSLNESSSIELELNWISTEQKRYLLFWDLTTKNLQAAFYLYSNNSLLEQESRNDEIIEKGYSVGYVKFDMGKRIKDWK